MFFKHLISKSTRKTKAGGYRHAALFFYLRKSQNFRIFAKEIKYKEKWKG